MIGCHLNGGLGNQLFQIATTISYCMEHKREFVFPKQKHYIRENNRPTYWDTLLRELSPFTIEQYSDMLNNKYYNEPQHYYVPIPPPEQIVGENGQVVLKGYFQSFKYFHKYNPDIMELSGILRMREKIISTSAFLNNAHEHSVSIHFRFGDYKNLRCYHPVLSPEYYALALLHIIKTRTGDDTSPDASLRKPVVYCFFEQDDVVLVDEYLDAIWKKVSPEHDIEFRKIEPVYSDWEQMLLMSGCEDHIIANSTFSWWSAYINPRPDKIVCYPNAWYGHQLYYIQTMDMFPPEWTCIAHDHSFYQSYCKCLK